jgi:hypothetical protein
VTVRPRRRRRMRGWQNVSPQRSVNNRNATLQLHENLTIQPTRPPEQPHEVLSKKLNGVVVQVVLRRVKQLHLCPRLLHPNSPRADGKSRFQRNSSSRNESRCSIYYNTTKCRDNSYCGCLYSVFSRGVVGAPRCLATCHASLRGPTR